MNQDLTSSRETSIPSAFNDFLNHEIQRVEIERYSLKGELRQIQQSYAWRMVGGYRQWIAPHRHSSEVGGPALRETRGLSVRMSVGSGEQDERKRYRDWQRAHEPPPIK
jgi:hypothetical protein